MAVELKVPAAGESITEVEIGEWLKKEGDSVKRDENVVVIETDKVTVEVPAPIDGVISQIIKQEGEEASVGDVIGYMEEGSGSAAGSSGDGAQAESGERKKSQDERDQGAGDEAKTQEARGQEQQKAQTRESEESSEPPRSVRDSLPPQAFARVMPSARRAAVEAGIDPSEIKPTGPGGRLLKEDVERHLEEKKKDSSQTVGTAEVEKKPAAKPAPVPAQEPHTPDERGEEIIKMSPMRRKIAERLVESQQQMALLTTFNECDMSSVIALRKQYQDAFVKKYSVKLGFMSFFVKAAIEALKEIPSVNAEIRGREIIYKNYYDIGIAVGGGKGLVVPVIRNADRLSFSEVELTINDFGARAKNNQIKLDELQGGTFTISNGGVYGSMLSTPIVNPPQSGIMGLHNIVERPMAVNGKVEIRPIMYLALTYDHRLVDGREAVTFLKRVKECIEAPTRILIEV